MVVIRPVTIDDIDSLLELANLASHGLTTLPKDRKLLARRVQESVDSFGRIDTADRPRGEVYLFVMDHLTRGKIVGTCGIDSKVGGYEPFYAYRIETSVHESKMLEVRKEVRALHLVQEHDGPCEIGSLFLSPHFRKSGYGRLLSLSRFLFMAEHPKLFAPMVIAEMRGVLDRRGRSAFWEALGRHFFEIDYPKADYLSMVDKRFIADLMPTHPIYIPLLPAKAQAVIGQVHDNTRPALSVLESEGFCFNQMVDIFEAGPVMTCRLDQIRATRESEVAVVAEVRETLPPCNPYVIANPRESGSKFRIGQGPVLKCGKGKVELDHVTALALKLRIGDRVRYSALQPPRSKKSTKRFEKKGVRH